MASSQPQRSNRMGSPNFTVILISIFHHVSKKFDESCFSFEFKFEKPSYSPPSSVSRSLSQSFISFRLSVRRLNCDVTLPHHHIPIRLR